MNNFKVGEKVAVYTEDEAGGIDGHIWKGKRHILIIKKVKDDQVYFGDSNHSSVHYKQCRHLKKESQFYLDSYDLRAKNNSMLCMRDTTNGNSEISFEYLTRMIAAAIRAGRV